MKVNPRVLIVREAIGKIIPMLVGRHIPVTQRGSKAFVEWDAKTFKAKRVNIPCLPDDASDQLLDAVQGFLDHECGHMLFTDSKAVAEAKKLGCMTLHNILEDPFIERKMSERFAGSAYNLRNVAQVHLIEAIERKMKELGFNPTAQLVIPAIRAWSGQVQFQKFMEDKWHLIPDFVNAVGTDLPKKMPLCQTSWDTLEIAKEIMNRVKDIEQPESDGMEMSSESSEKGSSSSDCEGESKGEGDGDDSDDGDFSMGKSKSKKSGKKDKKKKEDKKDKPKKSKLKKGKDEGEEEGDGTEDQNSESETDGQDQDSQTSKEEEGDGSDSSSGEREDGESTDSDDAEGGSSGDESNEEKGSEGGDNGAAGDDDGNDGDSDGEGDSDSLSDDGGDSSDEGDGDQEGGGEDSSGDSGSSGTGDQAGAERLEGDQDIDSKPSELDEYNKPWKAPSDSGKLLEDIESVKDYDDILAESITGEVEDGSWDYMVYTKDYDEMKPIPVPDSLSMTEDHTVRAMMDEVDHMVGPMQKDLERLIAARTRSVYTGGHKSGRLHGPSLARLRFDRVDVFRRKQENTSKSVAVATVVDCSGSMLMGVVGGRRIQLAAYAAYGLTATLDRASITNACYGYTTKSFPHSVDTEMRNDPHFRQFSRHEALYVPIFKDFGERVGPHTRWRFAMTGAGAAVDCSENVDGESLMLVARQLIQRREERKIMFVFSDGMPACGGLSSKLDAHLKSAVKQIEASGIEVIGIGIQTESVKRFYQKNIVLMNVADLPGVVMQEMKKLLLK